MNQFVNVHAQRARAAIDMERWELALEETAKALADEPNSSELHAIRAQALYQMRDYREAGESARVAISLDPEWFYPYYLLSWCILSDVLAGPDRLDAAREVADAAMAVAPNEPANHFLQAEIAYFSNQPAEGMKFALAGLALDPENKSCLKALTSCQLAMEDYVAAEGTLRRLLSLDPESAFAHENLTRALLGQSKYANAYEHARTAVRLEPNDADLRQLYRETVRFQNRPARVLLWISHFADRRPFVAVAIWLVPIVLMFVLAPNPGEFHGELALWWVLGFVFHGPLANAAAEMCIKFSRQRKLLIEPRRRYVLYKPKLLLLSTLIALAITAIGFVLAIELDRQ